METVNKVSKEVALEELQSFVEENIFKRLENEELEDNYPQVLSAMMSGHLTLGEEPEYKLQQPVKSTNGETVVLERVKFKTRITVGEKTKLAKGVDMKGEALKYSYACMAFVMSLQSTSYLDRFTKYDLRVCEQLSTLFV